MHSLSTLRSRGPTRQFSQIPCVGMSTRIRLPQADMSDKIEMAKAWLGDRWLLTDARIASKGSLQQTDL